MAKKRNSSKASYKAPVSTSAGSKPQREGRKSGTILGVICLLAFVVIEQLWIAIAVSALVLGALYFLQVFGEKSASWYGSGYLYATIACAVLAYLEYSQQVITNLINLGK